MMANKMKGSAVGLLVLMLPALVPAAVFNWNHLGKAVDRVLHFEPRKGGPDHILIKPETDTMAAPASPAFCNGLDCPEFTVLKNESNYQLREYKASGWVSTTSIDVDYDKAQYEDFERLFHYISGENVKKQKIKMTAPVINRIIPGPGPACVDNFTMSFFVSPREGDPPKPSKKTVFLSSFPKMQVYVSSFGGFASKQKWLEEAAKLAKALEGKAFHKDFYYTAGYNSPFQILDRHNEVWFIAK